jgi:MFS family permease
MFSSSFSSLLNLPAESHSTAPCPLLHNLPAESHLTAPYHLAPAFALFRALALLRCCALVPAALALQAIIISDLVSLADRGLYQGGVNVLFGAGAALGAVMGGAVSDRFGWRMAFWAQIPPILLATILVITQVHVPHVKGEMSAWEKVKRIDWAGSVALMVCVSSVQWCFYMSIPWSFFEPPQSSFCSSTVFGFRLGIPRVTTSSLHLAGLVPPRVQSIATFSP